MKYESFFSDLEMFGIKLGLDQTRELFARIGNPEKKLKFIHIAGTNGKGSVASMLAGALSSAGFKTGLYTSPHLVSVRERFRTNGKAISRKDLSDLIQEINLAIDTMKANGSSPTYFEVTTALAAAHFAKNNVDFAVWETGLGGRFDATNIVTPIISIITGIGIDHTTYLGSTLAEIAFEKAGIIKENIPVFCGPIPEEAEKIIRQKAREMNSVIHITEEIKEMKKATGNGRPAKTYQAQNRALAEDVLKYLSEKFSFSLDRGMEGMEKVNWPGRFQIFADGTIIDGAHNPQAAKALISSLADKFPQEKYSILFASFADKDAENTLKVLAPVAEEFIFAEVGTSRKTCHPDILEQMVRKFTDAPIRKVDIPAAGLKLDRKARLLVTGSLYLVGAVIKEFIPESKILDVF